MLLFVIFFAHVVSNLKIKADNISTNPFPTHSPVATQTPIPTGSPIPTSSPIPTPSYTPLPTHTPTKSFELYLMVPLQSNAVNHTISLIAIISLTITGTVSIIYVIFYLIPFMREDFSPLL